MSNDIKEILKKGLESEQKLSQNHRKNFEAKLYKELHSKPKKWPFLKVAASFALVLGMSFSVYYFSVKNQQNNSNNVKIVGLGSISPELKKVEDYYLVSINAEILNLQETPENKELVNGYLEKIGELTKDYKTLTTDLNTEGINEKAINALIENLQLRLKLLLQLKEQLKELQNTNVVQNENVQV